MQNIIDFTATKEQVAYLRGIKEGRFDPAKPCDDCGAPMGEHIIGGAGPFHPRPVKSYIPDEVAQKAEWRGRLVRDLILRQHDTETLAAMLDAGLQQAHTEGVLDCVDVCQRIAAATNDPAAKNVAGIIADALRNYNARNVAAR